MNEYSSYWLITKTGDGFAIQRVNKKLRVRFNGEEAVIKTEDFPDEIPVVGLFKDEEEPNYIPDWAGSLKAVEKMTPGAADKCIACTFTWIDMKGGRIFCLYNDWFAVDLYGDLIAKKKLDELRKERQ